MKEQAIKQAYYYATTQSLESISLVKISNDLNISRRSLYRIFTNKYDLMFEVYKLIIDELLDEAHSLNKSNVEKDGYHQTILAMHNMIDVFLRNGKKLKYITKFDALDIKNSKILKEKNEFYRKCDFTYGFLVQGVADKSISDKIEPYKMSCVILENIIGVVSRFLDVDKPEFTDYMETKDVYSLVDIYAAYLKS